MAKKKGTKNKPKAPAFVEEVSSGWVHEETGDTITESAPLKETITTLSIDTGREETNTIVAKINEIIEHINKQ